MTPSDMTLNQKRELLRMDARRRLVSFVKYTFQGYKLGWVHLEICNRLQKFLADVLAGKSPRLIITMPPRHGKSQIVSRHFPAWVFGMRPDMHIIAASYTSGLAQRMNRDVQRIMSQDEYLKVFPVSYMAPGKPPKGKIRTSSLFDVPGGSGSYRSAGVGGGITGMGCDILDIDDPIKDRRDADSATIRNRVWEWYTSTAYTRLAPGGGVLVTQTRWHEDDLAGRLIEAMRADCGDHFEVINYPAVAEQDEPHRKEGDPLHAARYPLEQLMSIKNTIGERDWAALYQQHPAPAGGAVFKREWFRHYKPEELPHRWDMCLQSWDFTFKDSAGADNVCGTVWGVKGANAFLIDLVCEKMSFTRSIQAIRDMTQKHPEAYIKLVEDKANGVAIIDILRNEIPGMIPVTPTESKLTRANAVTPFFEAGNVWLPEVHAFRWMPAYLQELETFPSAAHDDQVDSTTQAIKYINGSIDRMAVWT